MAVRQDSDDQTITVILNSAHRHTTIVGASLASRSIHGARFLATSLSQWPTFKIAYQYRS